MSCWTKIKMVIRNLDIIEQCCAEHNVSFELNTDRNLTSQGMPVHAVLKDNLAGARYGRHDAAYLCESAPGEYQLAIDNDPNWCSLTQRLGQNGGILMRSYSEILAMREVIRQGGMSDWKEEQPNKSLLIHISVPS